MKKHHIITLSLLFLNSIEVFYLILFKLGLSSGILYISVVSVVFVVIYHSFGRFTYENLYLFAFLMLYFTFQLINGLINSSSLEYSFVTFISFALTVYLIQIFGKMESEELFHLMKKIFYYTISLYILIDILSIFMMGKSQHVVLTNILPFLILTGLTISLTEEGRKASLFPLKCLLLYVAWLYVSLTYFTLDQRFQVKAVALTVIIAVLFLFLFYIRKLLPEIRRKVSVAVGIPSFLLFASCIFMLMLFLVMNYLYGHSMEGRETSLGLRIAVAQVMLQDVFSGSDINILFGYGLGSSMQEFDVTFGTQDIALKSHSGLLSLLYEHGLISILLLIIMVARFFIKPYYTIRDANFGGESYRLFSVFLLLSLFCVWFSLNTVYLVAINVPNFGHQTQLVSVLLLAVFLNRAALGRKRNEN